MRSGMRRKRDKYVSAELHRTGLDDRGRPIDQDGPTRLPRVLPWDRSSSEPLDAGRTTHDQASALIDWADLPDGTEITGSDQIYFPDGRFAGWWSVAGRPSHWTRGIQVELTRGRNSDTRR